LGLILYFFQNENCWQIATGFAASLSFGDGEYNIIITDPFTPQEERELEWYFEE
jgi:hypothetical protein